MNTFWSAFVGAFGGYMVAHGIARMVIARQGRRMSEQLRGMTDNLVDALASTYQPNGDGTDPIGDAARDEIATRRDT